jgi:hypothetical protein
LRQPVLLGAAAFATLLILLWQTSQLYGTRRTHGQAAAQLAAQLNATRSALVASKQLSDALARQLSTASSQKVVAERALAQAQQQQQAVQQQLQIQQQQLQQLQQQQAVQPSSPQGAPPDSSRAAELAGLHLLEVAGLQCNAVQDQEVCVESLCQRATRRVGSAVHPSLTTTVHCAVLGRPGGVGLRPQGARCSRVLRGLPRLHGRRGARRRREGPQQQPLQHVGFLC